MNEALIQSSSAALALHAGSAVLLLVAAVTAVAAIRLNKGAKANIAWGLLAGGFFVLCVSEGSKAAIQMDLPNLASWQDVLTMLGAALTAAGASVWRGLIAKMKK